MAQRNSIDEIIELYKHDVEVTLLDACLRRTVEERLAALEVFSASLDELRGAVREESDEVSEPTVTTLMRPGYSHGDRLLRPAMVGVTDPSSPTDSSPAVSGDAERRDPSAETDGEQ